MTSSPEDDKGPGRVVGDPRDQGGGQGLEGGGGGEGSAC